MSNRVAIAHEPNGDRVTGMAAWRVLEAFGGQADQEILDSVTKRLPIALKSFPKLAHETINVGVLHEDADANARAFGYNRLICLPPDRNTSNVTLWHELGHVAIRVRREGGSNIPKSSEEFCSIFSVARMPPRAIDQGTIPYIGDPSEPRETWPMHCQRALEYRHNSHDYIQQCRRWLGCS